MNCFRCSMRASKVPCRHRETRRECAQRTNSRLEEPLQLRPLSRLSAPTTSQQRLALASCTLRTSQSPSSATSDPRPEPATTLEPRFLLASSSPTSPRPPSLSLSRMDPHSDADHFAPSMSTSSDSHPPRKRRRHSSNPPRTSASPPRRLSPSPSRSNDLDELDPGAVDVNNLPEESSEGESSDDDDVLDNGDDSILDGEGEDGLVEAQDAEDRIAAAHSASSSLPPPRRPRGADPAPTASHRVGADHLARNLLLLLDPPCAPHHPHHPHHRRHRSSVTSTHAGRLASAAAPGHLAALVDTYDSLGPLRDLDCATRLGGSCASPPS